MAEKTGERCTICKRMKWFMHVIPNFGSVCRECIDKPEVIERIKSTFNFRKD